MGTPTSVVTSRPAAAATSQVLPLTDPRLSSRLTRQMMTRPNLETCVVLESAPGNLCSPGICTWKLVQSWSGRICACSARYLHTTKRHNKYLLTQTLQVQTLLLSSHRRHQSNVLRRT